METSESLPDGGSLLESLQSEHSCIFMTCYTLTLGNEHKKLIPNIQMTVRFVVQITEQRKLCVLSLHLSWTQFGCDNDAACLPLKDLTITSPNRTFECSWYYSVRFEWPGAAERLWPPSSYFKFSSSFPDILWTVWNWAPWTFFRKHIEDFILPSKPIALLNFSGSQPLE